MERRNSRKTIGLCIAGVLCLLISFTAIAGEQGSILLKALVNDGGTVYRLTNTEFVMYQVGFYQDSSWSLTPEFAKSGVTLRFDDPSAQRAAANKLAGYAEKQQCKGISKQTDEAGEVLFDDLEKGVYLFIQPYKKQIGDRIYQCEPFIITVPGNYDGEIVWNVTTEPKFKNESIPSIETVTPTDSDDDDGDDDTSTTQEETSPDLEETTTGSNESEPETEQSETIPTEESESSETDEIIPKTADSTNTAGWLLLMVGSAAMLLICIRKAD